jgi:hypothetical protein
MAKKMSTGTKILIAGGLVIGGVLIYKMISPKPANQPSTGPLHTPGTVVPTPAGGGGTLSDITSILDSLKNIFKGGTATSTTPSSNGGTYNPADYGMTYLAGRRRFMVR